MYRQQPRKKTKSSLRPDGESGRSGAASATFDAAQPSLRGRALRLLARREFSRQELQKRLRPYSDEAANPDELETLLDDLAERGWLSDARYADALVRKRRGQYAHRSIARELKQAGVDDELASTALAPADPDEEFAAALSLVRRKFRSAPTDQKETARQLRFLQARGYGFGLALRVIKHSASSGDEGNHEKII